MTDYERRCHRLILDINGEKKTIFVSSKKVATLSPKDIEDIKKTVEVFENRKKGVK